MFQVSRMLFPVQVPNLSFPVPSVRVRLAFRAALHTGRMEGVNTWSVEISRSPLHPSLELFSSFSFFVLCR